MFSRLREASVFVLGSEFDVLCVYNLLADIWIMSHAYSCSQNRSQCFVASCFLNTRVKNKPSVPSRTTQLLDVKMPGWVVPRTPNECPWYWCHCDSPHNVHGTCGWYTTSSSCFRLPFAYIKEHAIHTDGNILRWRVWVFVQDSLYLLCAWSVCKFMVGTRAWVFPLITSRHNAPHYA